MTYTVRPAERGQAKPLIGLYSESGCGKTLSALLLSFGFAGPTGKVVMIETESGRGEAYAGDSRLPANYGVISLRDDTGPKAFGEAIAAAEKAESDALILDSASLEWIDGPNCVNHQAAKNEDEGKKGFQVWQRPQLDHQHYFMMPLLRTPIPLVILCMRARYPMEEYIDEKGKKNQRRSTRLEPYQKSTILFEMYAHGWIDQAHRFHGTKYTRDELRTVLIENEPITLDTGRRLAEWAGTPPQPAAWEGLVADYELGFNGAPSREYAEALRAQWLRVKDSVPSDGHARVLAAIQRTRERFK